MARKKKNAGSVPLTSPQTRDEHYLANIAGLVETKPEYPFTRTERYLDVISGNTSGLNDRVTALENGKLNTLGKGDNLLINAHFYQSINQRGVLMDTWISATEPATYNFIDRWKLTSGRAKLTSFGVVLEGTMIQILEFPPHGDVVVSALTTDGYVIPSYDTETKTFTITATGETLVAAKLEVGTVQTLYYGTTLLDATPNYQQELAKCQRYLQIIRPNHATNGTLIGSGYVDHGSEVLITVPLSVPMATITSVTSSGVGTITNGSVQPINAISFFCQAENSVTVELTLNDYSTSPQYSTSTAFILSGGLLIISAE